RHRGVVASHPLGSARFLPISSRTAILSRRLHSSGPARAAYRPLLAAGMLLRLIALPFRRNVPRSRAESARAYISTLLVSLGLGPRQSRITNHKSQIPHA